MKKKHFETRCIHASQDKEIYGALNPPIYMSSTFTFQDVQEADDTFSFRKSRYVYTRGGNPTINLFENRVADLEGGGYSVAFASGMSAITSALLSLVKPGEKIIAHHTLYGSSFSAISQLLPRFGIKTQFIDLTDIDNVLKIITPDMKVIYFETPSNPSLDIIDIKKLANQINGTDIKIVIDNTFATPYFQRPLDLGADVVLHSATKYIAGHGDAVGGVAISRDQDYIHKLKFDYMCELGGVLSPFNAWLFLRGLKTLSIRMQKHEENAKALTSYLVKHSKITRVMYPGIESHPGHEIAKQQMTGYGGIVSFEIDGNATVVTKFINNLRMIKLAVSLGDAETLVNVPTLMTHRAYAGESSKEIGFMPDTIRISTGLEHSADIIEDIDQALNKI